MDPDPIREIILDTVEACLDAQLRAVRKLKGASTTERVQKREGRSQLDMAFDILRETGKPLHINQLLERIYARFGHPVDRESLVSALTKRVQRADRFVRTEKNTFGLRQT
jgi:hypothetical protein